MDSVNKLQLDYSITVGPSRFRSSFRAQRSNPHQTKFNPNLFPLGNVIIAVLNMGQCSGELHNKFFGNFK